MNIGWYYAWTPGGTLILESGAPTEQECIENLLREAAHMPYRTWDRFQQRGYTVEQIRERVIDEH